MTVTAKRLARASPRRPRQADLRRAVSTAYYALFHAIAKGAADLLVGTVHRNQPTWVQTYRALEHGPAKNACKQVRNLQFPRSINVCADTFLELQQLRHDADYDPTYRVTRNEALTLIGQAERAISELSATPREGRRAFIVHLLFKRRD